MNTNTRSISEDERYQILESFDHRCQLCDLYLEHTSDCHIDHYEPFSKGGSTTESNLRPLCPSCNTRRGNSKGYSLRDWQRRATLPVTKELTSDLLAVPRSIVVAAPSSGKTRFALHMAQHLGANPIVVSPSRSTVSGWIDTAAEAYGIRLVDRPMFPDDAVGASITYAMVASKPERFAREMNRSGRPTLLILDEVHHLESDSVSAWSTGVDVLVDELDDVMVLSLSGTAWRTNGTPISWVPYNENDGSVSAAYTHSVSDGIFEKDVRPVLFSKVEGNTEFAVNGERYDLALDGSEPDEKVESFFRRSVFNIDGELSTRTFEAGVEALNAKPAGAGGLVVCVNQEDARDRADWLKARGEHVVLAISDEADSARKIRKFARDSRKGWLVTVQMVSEGVDVPRLMVGLWFSNHSTRLFFNQVVHRCTRTSWDGATPDLPATWIIPNTGPWVALANEVESDVRIAAEQIKTEPEISEEDRICSRCDCPLPCLCERVSPDFEHLGDSATGVSYMFRGESVDAQLVQIARIANIDISVARDMASKGLLAGIDPPQEPVGQAQLFTELDADDDEKDLRDRAAKLANKRAAKAMQSLGGRDFGKFAALTNSWANKRCGISSVEMATITQLRSKSKLLSDGSEVGSLIEYVEARV